MKRMSFICIAGLFAAVCLFSYARAQNIGNKIAKAGEHYEINLHNNSYTFKSFYAKYSPMNISKLDTSHGVKEQYCVALTYVYKNIGRNTKWKNGSDSLIYKLKNGRFNISSALSNSNCWYWCQQMISK